MWSLLQIGYCYIAFTGKNFIPAGMSHILPFTYGGSVHISPCGLIKLHIHSYFWPLVQNHTLLFCAFQLFQVYSLYTSLGCTLLSMKFANRPTWRPSSGNKRLSLISIAVKLSAHWTRSLTVILAAESTCLALSHLPLVLTRGSGKYDAGGGMGLGGLQVKKEWQIWLPRK